MKEAEYEGLPTDYGGIMMRSHTEACFAEMCDLLGWSWLYEPFTVSCPDGVYIPDFIISRDGERALWVEIKPTMERALDVRGRVERVLYEYPDATLAVAVPVCEFHSKYDLFHPLTPAFAFAGAYWAERGEWYGPEHGWDGQFDGHVSAALKRANIRPLRSREVSLEDAYQSAPYKNYRTDVLGSVAWHLAIRGANGEEVLETAQQFNIECCAPPLAEPVVRGIVNRTVGKVCKRIDRQSQEVERMLWALMDWRHR